jgi:hypothetical protein
MEFSTEGTHNMIVCLDASPVLPLHYQLDLPESNLVASCRRYLRLHDQTR